MWYMTVNSEGSTRHFNLLQFYVMSLFCKIAFVERLMHRVTSVAYSLPSKQVPFLLHKNCSTLRVSKV